MIVCILLAAMIGYLAIGWDTPPNPAPPPNPTPPPPPAPDAPVPEPTDDASADKKFPWLKNRLDRARETATKGVLKDLGVDSLDAVKGILAKHNETVNAGKTEAEKRIAAETERDRLKADNERYANATKSRLSTLMAGLTTEQQALVPALPDPDKVEWLEKASARGLFGKPKDPGTAGGGNPPPDAGGEIKFDSIPETAPGVKVTDGKRFISRAWIASLKPAEYAKYEKDIDKAMTQGRLVP